MGQRSGQESGQVGGGDRGAVPEDDDGGDLLAEPGETVAVAMVLAERIARNAPLPVTASKRLVRASQGVTEEAFWALQKPVIPTVFGSADAKEGPRAFAEKRVPEWSGR